MPRFLGLREDKPPAECTLDQIVQNKLKEYRSKRDFNLTAEPSGGEEKHAGKIFVITGQVRNEYDHPRSNIKITGKLYRKGNALVNSATVYCGNMLSDADLERMDIKAITKRLQNRFGDNRSNIKVKSGKTIPFIIVFNKVPANLDEYTIEVAGSSS